MVQGMHIYSIYAIKYKINLGCFSVVKRKKSPFSFQTGMGLKSSTSVVRHAYIQCMGVAYHGKSSLEILLVKYVLDNFKEKVTLPMHPKLTVEIGFTAQVVMAIASLKNLVYSVYYHRMWLQSLLWTILLTIKVMNFDVFIKT